MQLRRQSHPVPLAGVGRRRLLQLTGTVLAAAGAASLAGCGGTANAAGTSRIRFWHLLSGGDGIKMQSMIDGVNAAHPEFHVEPTVLAWGAPYYTKLAMASAGGRSPELAIMHAARVPGYAPGGLLEPWDLGVLAEHGIAEKDFPARVWKAGTSGDKVYSIALDSHPFVMLYNADIAKKAGLLGADGQLTAITSAQEFTAAARELAKASGGHGLSYGYLGDGAQMWRLFYTLYRQHGATMELETGQRMGVNRDVAVDCLQYMASLLDDSIAARSGNGGTAIAEFAGQKSGMLFTGVWEIPTMKTAKVPFDAAPIPTLFGTPAAYADSHAFVLPRQTAPDATARRNVYTFVSEILKGSLAWAEAGHIPAFQPVVRSPEYAKLLPQAHYAKAAEIINYDPPAWFTGSGSNFQAYFADSVQTVLLGQAKASDGWDAFAARINTLLSTPNPV